MNKKYKSVENYFTRLVNINQTLLTLSHINYILRASLKTLTNFRGFLSSKLLTNETS